MQIVFKCIQGGSKYYSVQLNGVQIFVGISGECERFIEIHNTKVAQSQVDDKRTPRSRPVSIRTYRQTRAQA